MENCINLSQMQEIGEKLKKQAQILRNLAEETEQAEQKIKDMSYMDRTRQALIRTGESLEENIRVLTEMSSVIREAVRQYRRTEEKITDRCNLDTVDDPQPRFGVSRITGLNDYRMLLPF